MKKYLVTGAAGFIGSAIAKMLLKNGHQVWTIDNLSTGKETNLPDGIRFVLGNCQDESSIKALEKTQFDAILHFAGQSSGEISFQNPIYDLESNTKSTLNLINYALKVGCRRFIYASSMSVYGAVNDEPISESIPLKPLSFYGVGKLASEAYLRIYMEKGLLPTVLRLFNVYGPGQNLGNMRQGMVSIYLAQMLQSGRVCVKGSGERFRDFIYVDDVVDIACKMLDCQKSYGEIINVGTGKKTTVNHLLSQLIGCWEKEIPVTYTDSTPGDQSGTFADVSKCMNLLGGFEPINIEEGLIKMVDWARKSYAE